MIAKYKEAHLSILHRLPPLW